MARPDSRIVRSDISLYVSIYSTPVIVVSVVLFQKLGLHYLFPMRWLRYAAGDIPISRLNARPKLASDS